MGRYRRAFREVAVRFCCKLMISLLIVLFSHANGLSHAVIDSIDVYANGQITGQRVFTAGDTVTIKINASDPNSLPLEYVFRRFRENSLDVTLQNWSASNELTYTFVEADAVSGFSIIVGVRNNDGVDWDGFFGDAQGAPNFTVNGGLSPAVIDSLDVYANDEITDQTVFYVGDTVTIKINASDPNSLPLAYVFRRFRKNTLDLTLQDWSASNELTYTFVEADAVSGFSIVVGVRNNDGVDWDGFFGDAQGALDFTIPSNAMPWIRLLLTSEPTL